MFKALGLFVQPPSITQQMKEFRIGYLVPEFPGQTHTFFWREISSLERLGVAVNIASTRLPRNGLGPHPWITNAQARTYYLAPLRIVDIWPLITFAPAKVLALLKCIAMTIRASDATWKERLALTALLPYALKLAHWVDSHEIQHLHSHFHYRGADIVLFTAVISNVPYSISMHGPDWGCGNQKNKWRYAAFGTVITQVMREELRAAHGSILPSALHVISMGVDTNAFRRTTEYIPRIEGDVMRLFCCARIDPGKGQMDLVELAAQLRDVGIKTQIRIAGNVSRGAEKYLEEIMARAKVLGLEQDVVFIGPIPEDQVKQELEVAHLFVLPSRDEPLGVAYMEAMSMEVPTLGYRSGGVPELIEDRVSGLLAEPGSVSSLVDAVQWLVAEPTRAKMLGAAARERIVANYQSDKGAGRMAEAFRLAAKERHTT